MSIRVLFVFALAVVAIAVVYLYSFGPLAGQRKAGQINPASLEKFASKQVKVASRPVSFVLFHNKDKKENYYSVQFPQEWKVTSGGKPGAYAVALADESGTMELMDVPDNSTLELYVLSQEEPRLKKATAGYQRLDYHGLKINNMEAHQLSYASTSNGQTYETVRTYIAGADEAAVLTLTAPKDGFDALKPAFDSVAKSIRWENK